MRTATLAEIWRLTGATMTQTDQQADRLWSIALAETIMTRNPDALSGPLGGWTYWKGYTLLGFEALWLLTRDVRYLNFIKRQVAPFVDQNGLSTTVKLQWLDDMLAGCAVVALYEHTREERYRRAAMHIRRVVRRLSANADGGFWHGKTLPGEMWIDGVFMGQLFLTRYGRAIGDENYCLDEATKQISIFASHCLKDDTGLYYHAWAQEPDLPRVLPARSVRWADPSTGLSSEVWSEGLGWYALVVVETLSLLPPDHPRRARILDIFVRLVAALKRTQDTRTGRWFQVVDKGDRPDNWTDTSGSAMFTYAIRRGIDLGLLDLDQYATVVSAGYHGILASARVSMAGLVDILDACDGVAVQHDYHAYVSFPRTVNAKEAIGGVLWATALIEKQQLLAQRR